MSAGPDAFAGKRLLIVDDETSLLVPMQRYFERLGCTVATATSRAAAARLLETLTFDLVILDIVLAEDERGGLDVLAEARRRLPGLPVLVLSGLVSAEIEDEVARLGARRVLIKPQPLRELARVATELMSGA